MGKNKKNLASGDNPHSPSTVFVANLPFTFTNAQMEETFSEIGPIRRCFMVTKKGSTEHRGFGYVQFAAVEDAARAIELKNGAVVGGRKIAVKHAMHRAPLDQRRSKGNEAQSEDAVQKDDAEAVTVVEKTDKASKVQAKGELREKKKHVAVSTGHAEEGKSSDKQRVAKTVVFGGLLNDDMANEVNRKSQGFGTVCSFTYPLPVEELELLGLAKDGCRKNAASVVFTSVKSARECVLGLHQKEIHGGCIWARQLGGEGSKTQKWKLIVRNLPFKAKETEIKDTFSSVGFVWDVYIPQNPTTGSSKGYAFIKFTSKQEAENAIKKFNGQKFGKRPIAVDWAISKKIYTSVNSSVAEAGNGSEQDSGSSSGSDDSDVEGGSEKDSGSISESEDSDAETIEKSQEVHGSEGATDESDSFDRSESDVDFEKDAEIAKNVLNNLMSASKDDSSHKDLASSEGGNDESMPIEKKPITASVTHVATKASDDDRKQNTAKPIQDEEELQRTIFISNLPFDITTEEVKARFAAFGEVQSFIPVLHRVTKRPKGTGFLKFTTPDATDAAFSAAKAVAGLGILIKGRPVKVLKALDKKTATNKAVEKAKKEEHDNQYLYLAKEGLILEGMPAAEGVSENDMSKRKKLHEDKMSKLRSPNFRISRTRLIMYNVPKTMSENKLKQLLVNAVISRATKQKPVIRQVKILTGSKKVKEVGKTRPRGVAFIEFTEHQHALVALRVLNNNPDTFSSEHRPIVEFALDNVQKLKLRQEKMQAQQQQGYQNTADVSRKRKFKDAAPSSSSSLLKTSEEAETNKSSKKQVKSYSSNKKQKKIEQPQQQQQKSRQPNEGTATPSSVVAKSETRKGDDSQRKRKASQKESVESSDLRQRKRSKKSEPVGRDVTDKLDLLIEKYRSKFTSSHGDEKKQGGGNSKLKRWFES